jgi:hypothetical protein
MARKTETSYEVRKRWMDKAYKRYAISLRYDSDTELIDFIEKHKEKYGTTAIIRNALEMYIKSNALED